ncbi:hypothetical protein FRACA_1480003 [Frankia canadensis]|uniref:Zinc finger CHC2-type domain-containing protein n=1 Tax=Frankia canadensis TaxID=1836972 RepID=A0A2I2KLQ0_9ACTN|nr:hypothetical protein FRACA_1480003 [Frankia canadensis]SOU53885.1 hypothetical protein FRACA_1480003 [Frankia canadensis]
MLVEEQDTVKRRAVRVTIALADQHATTPPALPWRDANRRTVQKDLLSPLSGHTSARSHITGEPFCCEGGSEVTTVDRDAVLDRTDLAALATEICGDPQGRGRGARWHCPNPAHPDEHPSMGIYQGFQGRWRWKCHACGEGGTAVDLLTTGAVICTDAASPTNSSPPTGSVSTPGPASSPARTVCPTQGPASPSRSCARKTTGPSTTRSATCVPISAAATTSPPRTSLPTRNSPTCSPPARPCPG